jgi:hypothetical protein
MSAIRKSGLGLLLCWLALHASPQVVCALGPATSAYKASDDQRPTGDAMQLVSRVNAAVKSICASNCPAVAVLRNVTAANAMLVLDSGQAKLVYSPQFFGSVHDGYGDAGIFAVIAHLFGHALDDTLGAAWIQKGWSAELRADSWAGCALAKSDLNATDTAAALGALEKYPAPAHPSWTLRLPAIRAGYTACGGSAARLSSGKAGSVKK